MNKDNFYLGALLGFVAPFVGIFIVYCIRYLPQNVSLNEFSYLLSTNPSNITRYISLGCIAIIPLIAFYNKKGRFKTLKGIFLAIIVYAVLAIGFKFHWF